MSDELKLTLDDLIANVRLYSQLKKELGAKGVDTQLNKVKDYLSEAIERLRALPDDPDLAAQEPDDLASIRALRPTGPRSMNGPIDESVYRDRLAGAFLGRSAGCVLGSPVEGWPVERMRAWAAETGDDFPPTDYWSAVPDPSLLRYKTIRRDACTSTKMQGIPVDDDLQFTLLGLLILDEPTAGLDVETRVELHEMMRELRRDGTTIVLSTHDMVEAEKICDRIGIIIAGRLSIEGTPGQITAAGDRRTKIRVASTLASVRNHSPELPGAEPAESPADSRGDDGYAAYWSTRPADSVAAILDYLKRNDDELVDLRVERPSLEERFMEITTAANGGNR